MPLQDHVPEILGGNRLSTVRCVTREAGYGTVVFIEI